jgi:hypothetical protein
MLTVALEMQDLILEESKMTFVVSPRARYRHQVSGKFMLKLLELVVGWLAEDSCQCDMGHLGLDKLGRDHIGHGDRVVLNWHGQVCKGEVSCVSR